MTPERYQQVKSAFRLALEFPPDQRRIFLERFCAQDYDLLAEALTLLASDEAPATVIDTPAVSTQFRLRARSLSYTATAARH
ncbi:MAG TPA: hypothetical protein VFQ91_20605 [Bryobacteraceae bacterium]|nr:hypothetical protein [Bryobacteraceae bacterium]